MIRVPLVCNRHWAVFLYMRRHRKGVVRSMNLRRELLPGVRRWCERHLRGQWKLVTAQHLHIPQVGPSQSHEMVLVFTDPDDAALFRARWS